MDDSPSWYIARLVHWRRDGAHSRWTHQHFFLDWAFLFRRLLSCVFVQGARIPDPSTGAPGATLRNLCSSGSSPPLHLDHARGAPGPHSHPFPLFDRDAQHCPGRHKDSSTVVSAILSRTFGVYIPSRYCCKGMHHLHAPLHGQERSNGRVFMAVSLPGHRCCHSDSPPLLSRSTPCYSESRFICG